MQSIPLDTPLLVLKNVSKSFVMHLRDGIVLPVVSNVSLEVRAGECVALDGPSGAGKSSILKMIYGNYLADSGAILMRDGEDWVDIATAPPRDVLRMRERFVANVSQFLRVIPRVACFDLVAAAARRGGFDQDAAQSRAAELLTRLNIPRHLWSLPPSTFSGGEQQRVNIACGFAPRLPIMLLDEPTASLDAANSATVIELINSSKAAGAAIVGIFHDPATRNSVADRLIDVRRFAVRSLEHAG